MIKKQNTKFNTYFVLSEHVFGSDRQPILTHPGVRNGPMAPLDSAPADSALVATRLAKVSRDISITPTEVDALKDTLSGNSCDHYINKAYG